MSTVHKSVLLKEVIEGLNLTDGSIVIDGTFGGGGHTKEILTQYSKVKVIAIDRDLGAWDRAQTNLAGLNTRISFHNLNFKDLDMAVEKEGVEKVDAILLDLGLSSDQLDTSKRGFSFLRDEDLLMTMKESPTDDDVTAKEIVNTWSEESIADIIYGYGEETFARVIARNIILARKEKEINTTFDLVKIIESSVNKSYRNKKTHCATKTFQALRIATNDELQSIEQALEKSLKVLKKGGRLAVISFHSLEDRIVKNFYKERFLNKEVILINKKPIVPGEEELKENKRSRSAKLRILEKIL